MLYHGAASDNFQRLFQHCLDPRYVDSNAGGMYGLGIYLSSVTSKSDIYTPPNDEGERCIFVVRTMLGEPHFEKLETPGRRAEIKSWCLPPEHVDGRGSLSSVVAVTSQHGGRADHPEYIVYERCQCLPQFAIWYKHAWDC